MTHDAVMEMIEGAANCQPKPLPATRSEDLRKSDERLVGLSRNIKVKESLKRQPTDNREKPE